MRGRVGQQCPGSGGRLRSACRPLACVPFGVAVGAGSQVCLACPAPLLPARSIRAQAAALLGAAAPRVARGAGARQAHLPPVPPLLPLPAPAAAHRRDSAPVWAAHKGRGAGRGQGSLTDHPPTPLAAAPARPQHAPTTPLRTCLHAACSAAAPTCLPPFPCLAPCRWGWWARCGRRAPRWQAPWRRRARSWASPAASATERQARAAAGARQMAAAEAAVLICHKSCGNTSFFVGIRSVGVHSWDGIASAV